MSSIPGSVGYIPMFNCFLFIELTITWVPSGFSGYIWLGTKIVLKKKSFLLHGVLKNGLLIEPYKM